MLKITISISKITLNKCICPLLGHPKNFHIKILPICKNVILCYAEEGRILGRNLNVKKNLIFLRLLKQWLKKLSNLYRGALIPRVILKHVNESIKSLHNKYIKIKLYLKKFKLDIQENNETSHHKIICLASNNF